MRRGEVRERLVETARALCARDGVGATTIRGVIRETGSNLNSVHYHFGSWPGLVGEVASRAMEGLNAERRSGFEALGAAPPSDPRERARTVLRAAYLPLFRQALGAERDRHRPGLEVVMQLRLEPSGLAAEVLRRGARDFVRAVEGRLAFLALPSRSLRERMRMVNAAAWDTALRPDTLARVARRRRPERALSHEVDVFLDFAVAGLLAGGGT